MLLVGQLDQHILQLFGDGNADHSGVLQDGQALIGQIEEDHSGANRCAVLKHLRIDHIRHAHQQEDAHLLSNALEAHFAGQFLADTRREDAGEVVSHHKDDECVEEAIKTSEEPAEKTAQCRKSKLDLINYILHTCTLPFLPVSGHKEWDGFRRPCVIVIYINTAIELWDITG